MQAATDGAEHAIGADAAALVRQILQKVQQPHLNRSGSLHAVSVDDLVQLGRVCPRPLPACPCSHSLSTRDGLSGHQY